MNIGLRLFGWWVEKRKYEELRQKLHRARMAVPPHVYAATAIFYSLVIGVVVLSCGSFFLWFVDRFTLSMFGLIGGVALLLALITHRAYLSIPAMQTKNKASKIDIELPHATGFIHALSRSGATPVNIFKEISRRAEMPELAGEARVFLRDVEYLGQDPLTAMRGLASSTSSEKFKTFLETMVSIVETGGDIPAYFADKCSQYQEEAKEEQKGFISTLDLLSEVYVILGVFTPLLLLLLVSMLGGIGGFPSTTLYLVTYMGIPFLSLIFIVMVAVLSRGKVMMKPSKKIMHEVFRGVPIIEGEEIPLEGKKKRFSDVLRGWFTTLRKNPIYMLVISIPIGMICFILAGTSAFSMFLAILIALIPFIVVNELKSKRTSRMEEALPDFIRALASGIQSGLTFPRAFVAASTTKLGPLSSEIQTTVKDMGWGMSTPEALARLESRVSESPDVSRAISLIEKANEAEADVSDVLKILMTDVTARQSLKRERKGAMGTYKVVIFLVFFVFLFTVFMVVGNLLPILVQAGGGGVMGMSILGGLTPSSLATIFMHASLLEGFFAGIVASLMSEGEMKSGLKYSLILMTVAFVVFEWFVFPTL